MAVPLVLKIKPAGDGAALFERSADNQIIYESVQYKFSSIYEHTLNEHEIKELTRDTLALVLVGPTHSGKSTTLRSLLAYKLATSECQVTAFEVGPERQFTDLVHPRSAARVLTSAPLERQLLKAPLSESLLHAIAAPGASTRLCLIVNLYEEGHKLSIMTMRGIEQHAPLSSVFASSSVSSLAQFLLARLMKARQASMLTNLVLDRDSVSRMKMVLHLDQAGESELVKASLSTIVDAIQVKQKLARLRAVDAIPHYAQPTVSSLSPKRRALYKVRKPALPRSTLRTEQSVRSNGRPSLLEHLERCLADVRAEFDVERSEYIAKVEQLKGTVSDCRSISSALQSELDLVSQKLGSCQAENTQLGQDLERARNDLAEELVAKEAVNREIAALRNKWGSPNDLPPLDSLSQIEEVLEEKVAAERAHQDEIDVRTAKITELELSIESSASTVQALENTIKALQLEVEEHALSARRAEQQLLLKEASFALLIAAKEEQIRALEENLTAARASVEALTLVSKGTHDLAEKLAGLENQLSESNRIVAELEADRSKVVEEKEQLMARSNELSSKLELSERKLESLEEQLSQMEKVHSLTLAEMESLEAKLARSEAAHSTEKAKWEETVAGLEARLEDVSAQVLLLETAKQDLLAERAALAAEKDTLVADRDALAGQSEALVSQEKRLQEKVSSLEEEMSLLRHESTLLTTEAELHIVESARLKQEIARLQQELEASALLHERLSADLEALRRTNEEQNGLYKALLEKHERHIDASDKKGVELQTRIDKLQDLEQQMADLEQAQTDNFAAVERVETLEKANEGLLADRDELKAKVDRLVLELDEAKEQLATLAAKVEEVESENRDVRNWACSKEKEYEREVADLKEQLQMLHEAPESADIASGLDSMGLEREAKLFNPSFDIFEDKEKRKNLLQLFKKSMKSKNVLRESNSSPDRRSPDKKKRKSTLSKSPKMRLSLA